MERLNRVLKSKDYEMDKCGRMRGSSRKTSDGHLTYIKEYIQSSPQHESPYTRSHNPKRRYIHSELNIKHINKLYIEKCDERDLYPVREIRYRRVFKKESKLHFHQLRKNIP